MKPSKEKTKNDKISWCNEIFGGLGAVLFFAFMIPLFLVWAGLFRLIQWLDGLTKKKGGSDG